MNPAALYGLLSALTYGVGDFAGGLASKFDPPTRVVALSHPIAFVLILLIAWLSGERFPAWTDLAWGAGAGLCGLLGVLAFYRGLALGPMGAVSVTAAALSAVLPVAFGVLGGERLSAGNWLGVALILAGITALALVPGHAGRGGVPLGILAGLGFGLFFVGLAQTSAGAVYWPLAAARLTTSLVMLPLVALTVGLRPKRPGLILAATPGDALGNFFYLLAAQAGKLSLAGILTSLYPVVTTLLAAVLLRERLTGPQWAGVLLALAGLPLVVR